jgi:hypothetical protein
MLGFNPKQMHKIILFSITFLITGSEAHPTYYIMGTEGLSLGLKQLGREADHSLLSTADVNE